MRNSNPTLEKQILKKTLELLLVKEPYEIGMRDIAKKCEVSATAIYHYYKDKEDLFRKISLDCIASLNDVLQKSIENANDSRTKLFATITSFRSWCFENPRLALLIMGKIPVDPNAKQEEIEKYYTCNRLGQEILENCIKEKIAFSKNANLDTNIIIYGLWGCIESVLLKRADAEYWDKGIEYTDRYIQMILSGVIKE